VECGWRRGRAGHDGIEEPIHVDPFLFEVVLDVHEDSVLLAIGANRLGA
jgi:hypothetical protein